MRGIGVAVMCRTCGDEPRRAPCASSARALAHAEAVLLVDDGDRQAVEDDRVLDERVRAHDERQLARRQLAEDVGAAGAAGVEPVSSAAGTASPGSSAWSVAKCCSASVSVGAMSAACQPVLDGAQHREERDDRLARPDLAHQQPLHRPAAGQVRVDRLHRGPLVVRRREGQQLVQPARASASSRPSSARRVEASRGGARGGAAGRAGRAAARRRPGAGGRPRGRRRGRRPAPRGGRAAPRRPAAGPGSGSGAARDRVRWARTSARIWVEDRPSVAG